MRFLIVLIFLFQTLSTYSRVEADSIKICGIPLAVENEFHIKNTIEYHLENGIIIIREYYCNHSIKSESYWINRIVPVMHISKYNDKGILISQIDKSIGDFGLCEVMNEIYSNENLKKCNLHFNLSYSDNLPGTNKWSVSYWSEGDQYGSDEKFITYESTSGKKDFLEEVIYDQPVDLTEYSKNQLPHYPGGMDSLNIFTRNSINIPQDSIENAEVVVMFSVSSTGKAHNFKILKEYNNFLDSEALRIARLMSDWQPAKEVNKAKDHLYAIPIIFRKFE